MKISIITACYNSSKYIEQTILSVLNQTYLDIEYIVIDGASSDGTVDIILKYVDKIAYFISEPDRNMYDAINKGINRATGDYIAILNSDDFYISNTIISDVVKQIIMLGDSYGGVYGDVTDFDEKGKLIKRKYMIQTSYKELLASKKLSFVGHGNLFVSHAACKEIGEYNCIDFKAASDYDYILRLFRKYHFKHVNINVMGFRIHNGSITSSGEIEHELQMVLKKSVFYNINLFNRLCLFYWGWIKFLVANKNNITLNSTINVLKNMLK